jgi:hypothetical protein
MKGGIVRVQISLQMCYRNFILCLKIAQSFEFLMPSIYEVVKGQSSRNRSDRAIECLMFFEALLDSYPRIVTNNLKNIIEGLLRVAVVLNVDEISSRVLDVISCIICQKTKVSVLYWEVRFFSGLLNSSSL